MNEEQMRLEMAEAEKEFNKVAEAWNSLKYDIEKEYRHLVQARLDEEFKAKFSDDFTKTKNKRDKLVAEFIQMREQKDVVESLGNLPYPEGTILNRVTLSGWSRTAKVMSDEKGVLQVFRKGDEYNKKSRWSMPTVGDIVVRDLKKDGTLSKNVVRYRAPEWHFDQTINPKV